MERQFEWDQRYQLSDQAEQEVETPALAVYPELIYDNMSRLVARVGGKGEKLRPHAKTTKTAAFVDFWRAFGVTRFKCATIAEAEMLAGAGSQDILLAYPLVGPQPARLARLREMFPAVEFRAIADCEEHLTLLTKSAHGQAKPLDALLDVDVGMMRTGSTVGARAAELYAMISAAESLHAGGLHVYDGHTNQSNAEERAAQVSNVWKLVQALVETIESNGGSVPRIVVGGTGGFGAWADLAATDPRLECSPGTLVLNDAGYKRQYADLPYTPAACLLGRVVSKPSEGLLTIDLGSKAVAPDSSVDRRLVVLNIEGVAIVSQHEEHLVVSTPQAAEIAIGKVVYAWPNHICPTVALQDELIVVENREIIDRWPVAARRRKITI